MHIYLIHLSIYATSTLHSRITPRASERASLHSICTHKFTFLSARRIWRGISMSISMNVNVNMTLACWVSLFCVFYTYIYLDLEMEMSMDMDIDIEIEIYKPETKIIKK